MLCSWICIFLYLRLEPDLPELRRLYAIPVTPNARVVGKQFQHRWLFSSFPEIHLPTLLIRADIDVHTSIHKHKWLSTSKTPPNGPIKKCQQGKRPKETQSWGGGLGNAVSESLLGAAFSWIGMFPIVRLHSQWVGLREGLLALDTLWNEASVWTQREKQSSVDDVTEHPEESSEDKASYCLDPKNTGLFWYEFLVQPVAFLLQRDQS